ncbi:MULTISPECIES: hypothetical protein [Neobacillus]|uniref:DUF2232 domain-containing protein n=2 Tax=Neobacillus citreus TaxID=2833578 RepID=A0A9J6MKJ2_9BACI|nr:hypothetical protein [Neobacillus citreus]
MKKRINNMSGQNPQSISTQNYSNTTKLVLGSLLAGSAAILQAAGFFTGIGYAFSMLTTLPIVLASKLSLRIGFMSYVITVFLLAIIQPSELFVFPFTTGLLGLSLGIAFKLWKSWISITLAGGFGLSIGIMFLLYVLRFPVLGPAVSSILNFKTSITIFLFSLFYSLIWMCLSKRVFVFLSRYF